MKCLYIPKEINQNYVLLWRQDEVIFLMMPFIFLFAFGGFFGLIITLTSLVIVAVVIKNIGRDKPSGYMKHWQLFNNINLNKKQSLFKKHSAFPPSFRHIAG